MNDGFAWWLIVVGIAIGVGLVWVFVIRLPRSEADVGASETPIEAEWISRNIETYGGLAPQPLVEEVLELHRQYLVTGATPLPPTWRPSPDDFRTETGAPPPIPEPAETIVSGVAPKPEPEVVSDDAPIEGPSER
jgi:hypothetical protein